MTSARDVRARLPLGAPPLLWGPGGSYILLAHVAERWQSG